MKYINDEFKYLFDTSVDENDLSFDSFSEDDSNDKKFFVLVIYDISDNKRRNKMVKVLSSYGYRVQKSAFEALLRPNKYEKLINELHDIPSKTDSVRIYKIQGRGSAVQIGEQYSIEDEETVII